MQPTGCEARDGPVFLRPEPNGPEGQFAHLATAFADNSDTVAVPGISDAGLVNLPTANVRPSSTPFSTADFTTIPNVPVFAEHATTARDGRRLQFGRAELQSVTDRCNRRIAETGDYAAITIGHTPDPEAEAAGAAQPDVVGFAGPFRLGVLGQPGARQRYAILCDFHVFTEDLDRVKKHPRRSPELWLEDSYDEMFLDPIALLGSEAPRLDLGLLYSAVRHGRLIERYAAAAPAAGNVFIPSHESGRQRYAPAQPSNQGVLAMLSPDDVRQIVDALEQLDWVQYVKSQMQAGAGDNASVPGEPGSEPPAAGPAGPEPPASPPPAAAEPPAAGPPAAPSAGPPTPPPAPEVTPPPEVPAEDDDREKDQRYGAGLMPHDVSHPQGPRGPRPPKRYEAGGSVDGEREIDPAKATVEGTEVTVTKGSVDGSDGGDGGPSKYSRLASEMDRLRVELDQTQQVLREERSKRIDTERYAKIRDLRNRFAFDTDAEFQRCRYSKMSADQFADHCAAIEQNYRPIPVDQMLPIDDNALAFLPDRPGGVAGRERYNKQLSEKARHICEVRATRGQPFDYEEILDALHEGKQVTE